MTEKNYIIAVQLEHDKAINCSRLIYVHQNFTLVNTLKDADKYTSEDAAIYAWESFKEDIIDWAWQVWLEHIQAVFIQEIEISIEPTKHTIKLEI